MNLINYNQAIEALDKERQLLLNREQYGAEHILVHHAINVIDELPIIKQPKIVQCKDCKYGNLYKTKDVCGKTLIECKRLELENRIEIHTGDWFCADGKKAVK